MPRRHIALFFLCVTSGVSAAPVHRFESWDRNSDGEIRAAEFTAALAERDLFRKFNPDGHGAITPAEFGRAVFRAMDVDRDGQVSRPEFDRALRPWFRAMAGSFDRIDADEDRSLGRDEFVSRFPETGIFGAWDTSSDGELSQEELYTGLFRTLDLNNDGMLNRSEFQPVADDDRLL